MALRAVVLQRFAQPQLQLARGLLGERHGDDLGHRARPVASTRRMRFTSSVVLPVPAAASTTSVSSRSSRDRARRASASPASTLRLSSHRPQRREIGEPIRRLPPDPLFFARTAHRAEVAPGAGALGRRGGEKSLLDRAIDDLEHLEPLAARVVVDLDRMRRKAAGGRAVEQPAFDDRLPSPCSTATL